MTRTLGCAAKPVSQGRRIFTKSSTSMSTTTWSQPALVAPKRSRQRDRFRQTAQRDASWPLPTGVLASVSKGAQKRVGAEKGISREVKLAAPPFHAQWFKFSFNCRETRY